MSGLNNDELRDIVDAAVHHAEKFDYVLNEDTAVEAALMAASRCGITLEGDDRDAAVNAILDEMQCEPEMVINEYAPV